MFIAPQPFDFTFAPPEHLDKATEHLEARNISARKLEP